VGLIPLAQDKAQWRAFVNNGNELLSTLKGGEFLEHLIGY
jgi:hypothetical protein